MPDWYVVHTKPRQEVRALQNLMQQGYGCFMPTVTVEKVLRDETRETEEPLFPRYLFVQLDGSGLGKSWAPIRSTKGVSRLVCFGTQPAKVDAALIAALELRQAGEEKRALFAPGDQVLVTSGPFAGLDAVYQMRDGEARALVLIEMLSKPVSVKLPLGHLRQAG